MTSERGPVRYGIVGTGMMGLEHIANIAALDGAVVAAIADPHETSRSLAATAAPWARTYENHRSLLDEGECDAVVVAVPNHLHHEVLLDVAAADVHFLAEKPLCVTAGQCRDVLSAARGSSKVQWMGLEYRYKPAIARLIDLHRDGVAGQVRMITIREHRYPFLQKIGDWNRFNRFTGGTLVEKCCHFFDLMTLLAGATPAWVSAAGAQDVNHLDERYGGEIPDVIDNAFVIVEYDNGVRAMLDLCMFAESGPWEQEVSLVGDRGKLEAFVPISPSAGFGRVRIGRRWEGVVEDAEVTGDDVRHVGLHSGASYLEHVEFLAAILDGTAAKVTLEDGLRSVVVAEAAQLAIAEGRRVEISGEW